MTPGVAGMMRELAVARSSARRESRGGGKGGSEGLCGVMPGGRCPWAAVCGGGDAGAPAASCCPWDASATAVCPWETELSQPWQG